MRILNLPTISVFCLVLLTSASICFSNPDYNLPLNRPYTLKNTTPFALEQDYHQLIKSDVRPSYIFPRSCQGFGESLNPCRGNSSIQYGDNKERSLNINLLSGLEYRYQKENVEALDFGVGSHGFHGPLSFYLDARMFVELHEDFNHPSYDREFIERQDEEASDAIAYTSYSRYRSNLNLNTKFGQFTAARDALHWGPGLFHNLAFQQNAVPFNYLSYASSIGPLKFITVYGSLSISANDKFFSASQEERNLYAHRYEISLSKNLLFGISEQLILYNNQDPFAFVPIVPLYITKGTQVERSNNGNIAFDISYRLQKSWHIYSEFLIDDLQAPTALFNDFWGNKWGAMAGIHKILDRDNFTSGVLLEASRIEPWVYTHYQADHAQTAHHGFPLGNQAGPNSQNLTGKIYFRHNSGLYTSLQLDLSWKGTDLGSGINDEITREIENSDKVFLRGIGEPQVFITPYAAYSLGSFLLEAHLQMGSEMAALARLQYAY